MPLPDPPNVAIVGATGAVGRELLELLAERRFPVGELRLLASARSAGTTIAWRGEPVAVRVLDEGAFDGIDLALFSAGGSISRRAVPWATTAGAVVVDNSSAFRMHPDVPLVVPEINGDRLETLAAPGRREHAGIIANPNCSTILALMAVTPLHRAVPIRRMVVSTYQAASGAGAQMMAELEEQAREFADGRPYTTDVTGRQYLFNVFSHDSAVGEDGYNEEELKLVRETHKIWDDDSVRITATCVRVPVLRAHCEAINLSFDGTLDEADARRILTDAPGVRIVDDRAGNAFPEPIEAAGLDDVLVGRIRGDMSLSPGRGLDLFLAGDQLRKGAALNAIQIAEWLFGAESGQALTGPELTLDWLPERFAVCRLEPEAEVPAWAHEPAAFTSITRTADELSIVTLEEYVPVDVRAERGWAALRVAGTLDFGLVGILARLTGVLADARVSVFAVSTYDTDYLMVREVMPNSRVRRWRRSRRSLPAD